ncbi:hypothetical protein ACC793_37110, partial [Rhizobium ruizarguesonis]
PLRTAKPFPAARAWQDPKPGPDAVAAIAGEVLMAADVADPARRRPVADIADEPQRRWLT